jgi:hypothetical protein
MRSADYAHVGGPGLSNDGSKGVCRLSPPPSRGRSRRERFSGASSSDDDAARSAGSSQERANGSTMRQVWASEPPVPGGMS